MGKKILLADDSITIQKVIELTFSDEDFEVVTVGNGRLAIEKLEEVRPDIVLCDIIMPEKDGYEVCDHVKKHPSLGHVPVLLLTGAFEPFDQEKAARVGCDGFLAKPFEPQSLITKVKDLLSQAAVRPRTAAPAEAVVAAPAAAEAGPAPVPAPPRPTEPTTRPPAPVPAAFMPEEPEFEPVAEPEPFEPAVVAPPPVLPLQPPAFEPAAGTYHQPMELTPEPDTPLPPYVPPPPPPVTVAEDFGIEEPVVATADEFMPLMADESQSLQAEPPLAPPEPPVGAQAAESFAAPEEDDGASTVVFQSGQAPAWSSPTVEVPLETRAQASAAAAAAARPVFHEPATAPTIEVTQGLPEEPVFEPDFGEPAPMPEPEVAPAAPVAAALPPVPEPPPVEPPPLEAPPLADAAVSFADLRTEEPEAPEAPPAPSHAAEVAVPMEQVAQIAQRVVAQISEKVVREVAWEVIPDLAEALIKKEIARLRAELDKA